MAIKTRGSGSPFKCVGTGLAQQVSFENDADLFSYQRRIDELEALASSRQKEVCVAPELKISIEVKASRILINIWQWSSAHWDQGFKAFTKIYIDKSWYTDVWDTKFWADIKLRCPLCYRCSC